MSDRTATAIRQLRSFAFVGFLAFAGSLSCGGDGGPTSPSNGVATLIVSLAPSTLLVGQAGTATVAAFAADGSSVPATDVAWASGAPTIATVSASGVVTGVSAGQTQILATAFGKQALAAVTVTAPTPVSSVVVTPPSASILAGQTLQLNVTTRDASGNALSGRVVTLNSSNNSIASVSSAGLVTAVAVGTTTIIATSEGKSATSVITVTSTPPAVASVTVTPNAPTIPVSLTQQLTASAVDANSSVVAGATFAWTSSNANVATVSASGVVTAVAQGTAMITATSQGKTGTSVVTVVPAGSTVIASVVVSPASAGLARGQTQQLAAAAFDASGNAISGATFIWSSNANAIATVSSTGLVTAQAVGTAIISATSGGTSGLSQITISSTAPVAAQSSMVLNKSPLLVNEATTLSVTLRNGFGAVETQATASSFTATATGGTIGTFTCTNGVCTASYTAPATSGSYSISVTIGGAQVNGSPTAVVVSAVGTVQFASIYTGYSSSCALTSAGAAYCWGDNAGSQLGDGSATDRLVATPVSGGLAFTTLAVGQFQTCGLTSSGAAYCWGTGGYLNGSGATQTTPSPVSGGLSFTSITAGRHHTCALTSSGAAWCWGANSLGELGDGTNTGRPTPTAVVGGLSFVNVTAGDDYTCGVVPSNAAYCWGDPNVMGPSTGVTVYSPVTSPRMVLGNTPFLSITVSPASTHTCGVAVGASAYCWGDDGGGRSGGGHPSTPTQIQGGLFYSQFAAGGSQSCGLTQAGAAYCIGSNGSGQLGSNGTPSTSPTPVAVAGNLTFARISVGGNHACGLTTSGIAYCWGDNSDGQIGDGTVAVRAAPVPVQGVVP